MKISFLIKIIFLLSMTIGKCSMAHADHITGGEMYYQYAGMQGGNYIYNVTLRLLMRCASGRRFPDPIIVGVFYKEGGGRLLDITVPLASQQISSLQNYDPCISNPPNVCYEVATYFFDVAVPMNSQGYIITAQVNFRINSLSNLISASVGIGATYTAEIAGTQGTGEMLRNTSAQFTGSDLVVVCANSPFSYSFKARDADDDVLRYRLCAAYQTGTSGGGGQALPPRQPPYPTVPYGEGYDGDKPLGERVSIDPVTGLVSGIAPASGYYVLTVCVDEIRNGVVIATQRKDIQLNITGCTVAAAILENEYLLCGEEETLNFENRSLSPLIQTYSWRILDRTGRIVSTSGQSRFSHRFADTGTYRIILQTNIGLACPDSTEAKVLVYPGTRAQFDFAGLCFENPTQFNDRSGTRYGVITGRQWSLGEPPNSRNFSNATNPEITYLTEGTKTAKLVIYNNNGCRDSLSRQFIISKEPSMQLAFKDTLICLPDTFNLQAFGEGQFTWSAASGLLSGANSSSPRVAPLVTSYYPVIQRVGNCVAADTVRVQVTSSVSLFAMADTTICTGDNIRLLVSSNALQYEWTPASTLNNPNIMQPFAQPTQDTDYRIVASISRCSAEATIRVQAVPYPVVTAGTSQFICFGAPVQLTSLHRANRIVWSPATSLNNAGISNPVASPATTTTYTVMVYENNGCPKPGADTVRITVEPPINLAVTRDTSVVVGQPLTLNASGASRYLWTPGTGISNEEIANPVFNFSQPAENITYQVLGYNDAGCRDSLTVRIRVFANAPSIYVPTAFTPNGDGLNETLKPTLAGMQQIIYFRVFNRYGQIVFQSSSLYDAWDGRLKGQQQPSGSYMWMVQAIDFEGKAVQQKGSTMLIR
jgi:gliding motility-associated-like protein